MSKPDSVNVGIQLAQVSVAQLGTIELKANLDPEDPAWQVRWAVDEKAGRIEEETQRDCVFHAAQFHEGEAHIVLKAWNSALGISQKAPKEARATIRVFARHAAQQAPFPGVPAGARPPLSRDDLEYFMLHGAGKTFKENIDLKLEGLAEPTRVIASHLQNLVDRTPQPGAPRSVRLEPSLPTPTEDLVLWSVIRIGTERMSYGAYQDKIDRELLELPDKCDQIGETSASFTGLRGYQHLVRVTDAYLLGVAAAEWQPREITDDVLQRRKDVTEDDIRGCVQAFFDDQADCLVMPYLRQVVRASQLPLPEEPRSLEQVLQRKLCCPLLLELIWSYWMEEGMLVQTLNAISLRFQNKKLPGGRDPLAAFDLDPLRAINNLLWGYIEDEPHRLTISRRAFEYAHHYGLPLEGKAVPTLTPADSRSKFLGAFHHLLHDCHQYYAQLDDTTVRPDPFPLLNSLREVHLLLAEGAGNQYGDLPWTARREMLIQQWLLGRPEMQRFLGGRVMVPYEEPWMGHVDTMKKLQGWTDISITHFYHLARCGEQVLLSVRFGNWNNAATLPAQAGNWAVSWRNEIQRYIYAYRAVTGQDLTDPDDVKDTTPPSLLLRRRLTEQTRSR